jgi:hypothetical protein
VVAPHQLAERDLCICARDDDAGLDFLPADQPHTCGSAAAHQDFRNRRFGSHLHPMGLSGLSDGIGDITHPALGETHPGLTDEMCHEIEGGTGE